MTTFQEIISSLFILIGTAFMAISSVGIIRLPDFYIRMSAITKAGTLGVGFIASGIGIYFNDIEVVGKAIAIILFLLLTSPVSAHIIARAAFMDKVPFWPKTVIDEFKPFLEKHKALQDPRLDQKDREEEH
jgi:multicomponent Na+:H+ antiporter subunit G